MRCLFRRKLKIDKGKHLCYFLIEMLEDANNFCFLSSKRSFYIMKNHKFWAWAAVFCMFMVMYTGYQHK